MDEKLAQQVITLPHVEQMLPGFDRMPHACENTPLRDIVLRPLLDLAGKPIAIGTLIFTLSQLFEKFGRYQLEIGPAALASFTMMSEDLAEQILAVLIPDEVLAVVVGNEFVAHDLQRTAATDADHGCDGK